MIVGRKPIDKKKNMGVRLSRFLEKCNKMKQTDLKFLDEFLADFFFDQLVIEEIIVFDLNHKKQLMGFKQCIEQ